MIWRTSSWRTGAASETGTQKPDPVRGRRAEDDSDQQYHDDVSQYQSESRYRTRIPGTGRGISIVDCNGVVSSISEETGDSSSDDWAWNWVWNWSCGMDGASERAAEELRAGLPAPDPATQGGSTGEAALEGGSPWTWTSRSAGTRRRSRERRPKCHCAGRGTGRGRGRARRRLPTPSLKQGPEHDAGHDTGQGVPSDEAQTPPELAPFLPWIDELVQLEAPAAEVLDDVLLALGVSPGLEPPVSSDRPAFASHVSPRSRTAAPQDGARPASASGWRWIAAPTPSPALQARPAAPSREATSSPRRRATLRARLRPRRRGASPAARARPAARRAAPEAPGEAEASPRSQVCSFSPSPAWDGVSGRCGS